MRAIIAAFAVVLSFSPSKAEDSSEPISAAAYQKLSCLQIAEEGRSVSRKGFALSGLQPGTGGSNITETKSAVVIVWPTLRNVGAENVARLRHADRQMAALERASVESQCSIQFQGLLKK
jgi:hypothetical protein